MSKISSSLFFMSRRAYSVAGLAAESTKVRSTAAATMRKSAVAQGGDGKAYWMRDPKTGNWKPENEFEEVDVADLRAQLLSKNNKPTNSS